MVLDNWYQRNIVEKGYHDKIADSVFCNDRELQSGDGIDINNNTYYKTYQRFIVEKAPTLTCKQQNDRFTTGVEKGNGSLTYPVGLITSDELQYAGMANGYINKISYIYSQGYYWTMSPSYFQVAADSVQVMAMNGNGTIDIWTQAMLKNIVRPVINLKGNTRIKNGIGSAMNPFQILVSE